MGYVYMGLWGIFFDVVKIQHGKNVLFSVEKEKKPMAFTDEEKKARKKEADRRYREKHRETIDARYAEWVKNNPDKRKESWRAYAQKKRDAELKRIENAGADL